MRAVRRTVLSAVVAVFAGAAALAVFVRLLERVSVYFPEGTTPADSASLFGPAAEEVWFTASDGVRLNAVFAPAMPADAREPETKNGTAPVILFLHGNAGHLYHRADKARIFQELGASVFLIDYRGFGKSAGKPSEKGIYRDAASAYRFLALEKGIPADRILVFGESLGGAPATHLAAREPVGGLICEGCFSSAADMGRTLIPLLPYELLLAQRFPVVHEIRRVRAPVLLLHARNDEVVPFAQSRRLYGAARRVTNATLVPLEGMHNDAWLTDGARYREALRSFLAPLLTRSEPA
jgi:fermentation-respiration switch protein FrsA (DUF1100 family)